MAGIGAVGDLARVNTNIGALNTYNHLRLKNKRFKRVRSILRQESR